MRAARAAHNGFIDNGRKNDPGKTGRKEAQSRGFSLCDFCASLRPLFWLVRISDD
jgi:hypothetical protein